MEYKTEFVKKKRSGANGIDNLDYENLAVDLIENEMGKRDFIVC